MVWLVVPCGVPSCAVVAASPDPASGSESNSSSAPGSESSSGLDSDSGAGDGDETGMTSPVPPPVGVVNPTKLASVPVTTKLEMTEGVTSRG